MSMMDPHGLGGSYYIRNLSDRENKARSIERITWISEEARTELLWFLKFLGE